MRSTVLLAALLTPSGAAFAQPKSYSIADPTATLRAEPGAKDGKRAEYGMEVVIVEERTVAGTPFVHVAWLHADRATLGWTERSNLGSAKEFDTAMRAEDSVDSKNLAGLELLMAGIYNTRGKYLKEKATELGIKPSALAAVLKVESSGRGFGGDGRQIVRFENHIFRGQWGVKNADKFEKHFKHDAKERWKGHQWRKADDGEWQTFHGNQAKEWEVLTFARSLDENAALQSASYGAGQIMGFNHKTVGYDSADAMVKAFDKGIAPQFDAILAFIKSHPNCMKGLKADDYVVFARCYNGAGKEQEYGARIKEAADTYRKVTAGKKHAD